MRPFIFLPLVGLAFSHPTGSPSDFPLLSRAACADTIPNWTIQNLKVTYSEEIRIPGTATFTVVNSVTGASDALTCSLRANSHCQIDGTPNDSNLSIYLQMMSEIAYFTLTDGCEVTTETPKQEIVGVAELTLTCPAEYSPTMTCTLESGVIAGKVVELAGR